MSRDDWDYDDRADEEVREGPMKPVPPVRIPSCNDLYPEPWPEKRREHVNLDYGRRYRLLPREKQPNCGCGECLLIAMQALL